MDHTFVIIAAAYFCSIVSGLTGMGGGFLLLVFLTPLFPPVVLIPFHGSLQLISNVSRSTLFFKHINWQITVLFTTGAMIGAAAGSRMVISIPADKFRLILGLAILVMTWMPKLKKVPRIRGLFLYVGGISTFLSLFIGATGPLIAPFYLKAGLTKEGLVASKSACQIPLHVFKILVYLSTGFVLSPWLPILAGAIPAMFLGIWTGKKLLGRVPEKRFFQLLQIIISLLALRLLYQTLTATL